MYKKLKGLVAVFALVAATFAVMPVQAETVQNSMGHDPSGKGKINKPQMFLKNNTSGNNKQPGESFAAECPPTVKCVVVPAAYANNNPDDPVDYGNYDRANRPNDGMKINSVVVHDTEGTLEEVINTFQNPTSYVSSHYVIDKDGTVYQMVQNKDVAWHAGNWQWNMQSIGIEHIGHASTGSTDYTPEMYRASSQLVKWLSKKYGFPVDRQHVVGHDSIPAPRPANLADMHVDPGPFWNWQNYIAMAGGSLFDLKDENAMRSEAMNAKVVSISPIWQINKQNVTGGCWPDPDTCVPAEPTNTNFAYLRTEPRKDAPLIKDGVTGQQGTEEISNMIARGLYGQKCTVLDRKLERDGLWYQLQFGGQKVWLFSPWKSPTAFPAKAQTVTPKAGAVTIAVYGRPLPEKSEYPKDFTAPEGAVPHPEQTKLAYTIKAGEAYTVAGEPVKATNFYAWTYNSSLPYDHTVFTGKEEYVPIQLNNRIYYVKKSDVVVR